MTGPRISLLGGLEITGAAGAESAPLTRKAKALIAYLALRCGRAQSREKLADLLWGSSPEQQARTNLRQTLSRIRKEFGAGDANYLVTEGDGVALDPSSVEFDVAEFETLAAETGAAALEKAVALYKGDLLDGFSVKEEAFEAWVRPERERLRGLAIDASAKLMAHYERARDAEGCIETATRLLALDPLREAAHRGLMRAYAAQDRRGTALKQFEICRKVLERELGVQPEPETQTLFREIRTKRLRAEADQAQGHDIASVAEPIDDQPHRGATEIDLSLPDHPSIAVLPFENMSGDPEQEYFSDGISEDIITALSKIAKLLVIARSSSFVYKGKPVDVMQVSREQGVRYVLEGSVRKVGDRVRITAQLINAVTGHHLWAERYDRQLRDIFALQDEITREVTLALRVHLTEGEQARIRAGGTQNLEAWELVVRGADLINNHEKDENLEARRMFEQAVELDAAYAVAWTMLGWTHWSEIRMGRSKSPEDSFKLALKNVRHTLDLDETSPDGHTLLAALQLMQGKHRDAVKTIETAVSLAPSHSFILGWAGYVFSVSGRPRDAVEMIRKAMRHCPIYPSWYSGILGRAYRVMDRNDEAIAAFRHGIEIDPIFIGTHAYLTSLLGDVGREEEAKAAAAEVLRFDPKFSAKAWVEGLMFEDPALSKRELKGLRKAGLTG